MRLVPPYIRWIAAVLAAVAITAVVTTANAQSAKPYRASAFASNGRLHFNRLGTATTSTTTTSTTTTTTTTAPPAPAPAPAPVAATVTSSTSVDPFSDSWDVPLSNNAVLSGSSTIVANLAAEITNVYGTVAVDGGLWNAANLTNQSDGVPIVTVPAGQAEVPISVGPDSSDPSAGCNDFNVSTGAGTGPDIPIPSSASALVSGTNDSALIVYQPSTSTEWELWQADYSAAKGWTACDGGKLTNLATSTGTFPAAGGYGEAASGISYLGTEITEADVQSGAIDHVIAMAANEGDCNGFVAPATRGDCGSSANQVSEGSYLRFPASLAMPSGMTPFGQMVFKAIQNYGTVITDQSGGVAISTENGYDWTYEGHSGTDPITASWSGQAEYAALNGMPWSQLEVVAPS